MYSIWNYFETILFFFLIIMHAIFRILIEDFLLLYCTFVYVFTTAQTFGIGNIFFIGVERSLLYSLKLHLINQKCRKTIM